MASFVFLLSVTAMQGCQRIPENAEGNNFLLHFFDAEASETSLENLAAVLNTTAEEYFMLPKIMNSKQFNGITSLPFNATGDCGIDNQLDVAFVRIKTNQSVKAVFYGCSLNFNRNAKIWMVDELTRKREFENEFWPDKIKSSFNSTFCKCKESRNQIENCALRKEGDEMKSKALIIVAVYIVMLIIIIVMYVCMVSKRLCIKFILFIFSI